MNQDSLLKKSLGTTRKKKKKQTTELERKDCWGVAKRRLERRNMEGSGRVEIGNRKTENVITGCVLFKYKQKAL